jgi:hypothetical protein
VSWQVEVTDKAKAWLLSLSDREYDSIAYVIDALGESGPQLGRPLVDSIKGSRHHNMKELRSVGGNLRALFCFDPRRAAIILLGGNKTNDWAGWYDRNIPVADNLYDSYLNELETEGLI